MDELQATFVKNRIFVWGVSSHTEEVFTPSDRLERAYNELFSTQKLNRKNCDIELIVRGADVVMPHSMKLFYNQFDIKKTCTKRFGIEGLEVDGSLMVHNYLGQEKMRGILFGDSYEFFRLCLKFAFSLVSRQRFVPYFKQEQSWFLPNLDNPDDYQLFQELVNKAPLAIKPRMREKTEDVVRESLEYFVNLIIRESIRDVKLDIHNETKTDEWIAGLLEKKSTVPESVKEGLGRWLITRKVNRDLEYNMLFKLEEPDTDNDKWRLDFNMQSKKDPSLIIGLEEIWRNPSKILIKNAKIHLLKDLGIAAKVSKLIEKSLYKPNPHRIFLSSDEAMTFISNDSFLLKDIGFIVQIPKIISARINNIKVRVRFRGSGGFKVTGTGSLGRTLFDFDYSVAIGDLELSREELIQLSKQKEKLVRVKGKWVEINEKDVKKIRDYFERREKLSLSDTILANTSAEFEIEDISVPEQFKAELNGLFNFKEISQSEVPKTIVGTLRPYQVQGLSWMLFLKNLGFGGILADDMGLGKTIQAIAYLLSDQEKPSLIVCPTSVIGNWERELKKFSPSMSIYVHHGHKRLQENEFVKETKDKHLVISSYATARKDEETLSLVAWDSVILDEAQNIKNPYTKQTMSINRLKSKNRFCLTGTPIENRLSELWSIMNFINPGFLSDWKNFKKRFAEPIELQSNPDATNLLKKIITPFILRRTKTDKKIINDLPNKTEIKEYCNLTKEQASLYQAVVDDSLKEIEEKDENRRALIMAALIKLKQVCNHPSNYLKDSKKLLDRSGKVKRLRELVDVILQNNEKCLIFTQYKEMGDLLKTDLEDFFDTPVCFLHGQQNRKKREQIIDYFQSDDINAPKIFVLSLKAGGLGINLTKANHVIHFDRWWNPAVENQATDRAFRIGQRKDVFVYKFITTGSVEEKIDEMIERKLGLSDSLLSKGKLAITELDNEQLKEIFNLRKESLEG